MPRLNFGAFLAPHHPVGEHPMLQFRRSGPTPRVATIAGGACRTEIQYEEPESRQASPRAGTCTSFNQA